jgi:hypothetical protein
MPRYVIERTVPGVGRTSAADFKAMAKKPCDVLRAMGPDIQWQHSYVTDDKIYCLYIAPNEAIIREHAQKGGFPVDSVKPVREVIDPTTSE